MIKCAVFHCLKIHHVHSTGFASCFISLCVLHLSCPQEKSTDLHTLVHKSGSDSIGLLSPWPRLKPRSPRRCLAGLEAKTGKPSSHHSSTGPSFGVDALMAHLSHDHPSPAQCGQPEGQPQAQILPPLPPGPRPHTSPSPSPSTARTPSFFRLNHQNHRPVHRRPVFSSGSSWRDVSMSANLVLTSSRPEKK